MLEWLLQYWWVAIAMFCGVSFFALRFWGRQKLDTLVDDVLSATQSKFARGNIDVHSVKANRTIQIQDETAILYHIDATVIPSDENSEWSGSDLFLRGTNGDPNQVGDILNLKKWNGSSFEPIKNRAQLIGTQRLMMSIRFAGSPGEVRFNFNFANFGQAIQLPDLGLSA